jgi:putative ABC transport system permease protein
MLKNYLKIAFRNLKKNPFFTFLNVFGLAIGLAGSLLISLYIHDELSYDTMFKDANRIYRLNVDIKFGGDAHDCAVVEAPLAETMQKDFPQVYITTRFRTQGRILIKKSGTQRNVQELQTTFVDSTFFDMFGIKLLVGDAKTALKEPHTLVLTRTAAEKHFGINKALGQTLVLDNKDVYTVTGVIDDMPKNSFLKDYSVFMSMSGYADAKIPNWGSNNYNTFIKLNPNANIQNVNTRLPSIVETYVMPWAQKYFPGITLKQFLASGNYINFSTIPLEDIHLHSHRVAETNNNSSIQNVYILSFIALFLIILATFNFMNLSTASSLKRAKEVGIRKALGSTKSGLIFQFLVESGLITFGSLILAIIIAAIAIPFFNELSGKELSIPFLNPFFGLTLLLVTIILGLFSGSYPAFFMSKFLPVKVLKGSGEKSIGGERVRNFLVVFQFTISVVLIICTLVVSQQLKYIQGEDLGYTKDKILIINDISEVRNQTQSFKQQVVQLAGVKNATLSNYYPTPSSRNNSSYFEEGVSNQENALNMQNWDVDYDYLSTLGLRIIAGRNFNPKFKTDSTAILLNEATLKVLGISAQEALGKRFTSDLGAEKHVYHTVIGVVKDFHYESLRQEIGALSLQLGKSAGMMAVKLNAGDFSLSIKQIKALWNKMAVGQPFDYYFMDESFNQTYKTEQRLGEIFIIFSFLSILIACLGLFGLATFNAQKRTKEIGIRKVLGASVGAVIYKLAVDFLKLVIIAILISIPIGWYAMNKWLQGFSYKISMPWWAFVLAAMLAIIIALLTVSYQSINTAIANPTKSLRTE